ncbi:MAG: hypothetical protein ABIO55_14595, partial [Ginsengibacter sp.]
MKKNLRFKLQKTGHLIKLSIGFLLSPVLLFQATSAYSQPPAALITNITATTANSYTLGELVTGVTVYSDRTYQATSVPAFLNNASFIQTPNNDKSNSAVSLLSFDLTKSAIVYIAYDPRAKSLPAWLTGFQKLTSRLGFNDPAISYLELYSKIYPAGPVTLGGNLASPAAGSKDNYLVIALPQTYNLTITAIGSGGVTKN